MQSFASRAEFAAMGMHRPVCRKGSAQEKSSKLRYARSCEPAAMRAFLSCVR